MAMSQIMILIGVTILFVGGNYAEQPTAVELKIKDDSELSEFYDLLSRSELARVSLKYKQVTVFAPVNSAFQKHEKITEEGNTDELVLYHMMSVPKKTDELGPSYTALFSELPGTPIFWVTHVTGSFHDDIYINNAKILINESNIQVLQETNEQVIHKIDEVLVPTRSPKNVPQRIYNPTALEFLQNFEALNIDTHRLRTFRQRVQNTQKEHILQNEGGHTFFIPVDEGFKDDRASYIDGKVIDGHVIPRHVLFTAPTKKNIPFMTLANGDNDVRVVISFTQEIRGKNTIVHYVKSHTLLSDGKHSQGVVLAEIVKANIPVKNGVVHLIQRPLMVVDSNVKELLRENREGLLNNLMTVITESGPVGANFLKQLELAHDVTLFAPCNNAFDMDPVLKNVIRDSGRFSEILNMHIVLENRLYVDEIMKKNQAKIYQSPTMNSRQNLYFNVMTVGNNRTVTVEGGGVNATILQADLAATNGIIHIIDRVLGVPYTTIQDKLRTDPMLNKTYYLGSLGGFNNQLNDVTKRFTYFIPRDKAWEDVNITLPSQIKVLFMSEFSYHATNLLERHLVIDDAPYTMERIKQLSNDNRTGGAFGRREVNLPTMRGGSLRISVEERGEHSFFIHWKGEKIPVFRPNVECTNGIIHVIDLPFIQDGDIRINGAQQFYLTPHIMMLVIAKWLIL